MNYIKQLQQNAERAQGQVDQAHASIDAIMKMLASEKYVGFESDGSRKDWISTGDVMRLLSDLRSELPSRTSKFEQEAA